jgi:hypothetical protein
MSNLEVTKRFVDLLESGDVKGLQALLNQYLRQVGGRNWIKSGMNHAQTGNLLENLG